MLRTSLRRAVSEYSLALKAQFLSSNAQDFIEDIEGAMGNLEASDS